MQGQRALRHDTKTQMFNSAFLWPSRLCSSVVLRSNYVDRHVNQDAAKPPIPVLCEVRSLL
jgi:hypothetical protein